MVNKSLIYKERVDRINKIIENVDIDKSYKVIKNVLKTDEPEYTIVDFMIKINRHIKGENLTMEKIIDLFDGVKD